jgi:uncharacterized protein YegP (UPF0339 family)
MSKGEYILNYKKINKLYYWEIYAPNNELIGRSEQGFKSKQSCKENLALIQSLGQG